MFSACFCCSDSTYNDDNGVKVEVDNPIYEEIPAMNSYAQHRIPLHKEHLDAEPIYENIQEETIYENAITILNVPIPNTENIKPPVRTTSMVGKGGIESRSSLGEPCQDSDTTEDEPVYLTPIDTAVPTIPKKATSTEVTRYQTTQVTTHAPITQDSTTKVTTTKPTRSQSQAPITKPTRFRSQAPVTKPARSQSHAPITKPTRHRNQAPTTQANRFRDIGATSKVRSQTGQVFTNQATRMEGDDGKGEPVCKLKPTRSFLYPN